MPTIQLFGIPRIASPGRADLPLSAREAGLGLRLVAVEPLRALVGVPEFSGPAPGAAGGRGGDLAVFLGALSLVPLRPGAMAALVTGNFDKRLSTLTIGKDKHGQDRKITLPPATAAFFADQCKDKLPTAPLLARADGSAWNKDAWKYPFKDAVIAAELPAAATAYALRHSTITDLIALHKLDTLTVAQLSGTSLLMIEKHYGHLLREHAAKALASLTL